MRIFFSYILPLFLPSILYFAYGLWEQRQKLAGNPAGSFPIRMPWVKTLALGVVLVILVLWGFGFRDGASPDARYQSPRFVDGEVVPGYFIDAPDHP